jgi:hypothetical protein
MHEKLYAACSRHFRYIDLIACGETWERLHPNGEAPDERFLPQQAESWDALGQLGMSILDPLVDHFGQVTLTYGFAGPPLTRRIPGRIAPKLDQHAAYERDRNGAFVCPRRGAAIDVIVPGQRAHRLAAWIAQRLLFDRMYIYAPERPLHVSIGPDQTRGLWMMRQLEGNRSIPVRLDLAGLFLNLSDRSE